MSLLELSTELSGGIVGLVHQHLSYSADIRHNVESFIIHNLGSQVLEPKNEIVGVRELEYRAGDLVYYCTGLRHGSKDLSAGRAVSSLSKLSWYFQL